MSQTDEAWTDVGEQLKKLGSALKQHYEAQESDETAEPVSQDDVKQAIRTLGNSIKASLGAVGDAATDPDLHDVARQTVGSFFEAIGVTFSEVGSEISKRQEEEEEDSA